MILDKRELLLASLHNQYLLEKTAARTVVSELCGLQAQFANNPRYALRIRAGDFSAESWNDGLVKTWTFRGTLHTVLEDELGLHLSAKGTPEGMYYNWGISGERMEYWAKFLLERIDAGVCKREELRAACVEKGISEEELKAVLHGWGGALYELCLRGFIAHVCDTSKSFVRCEPVSWLPEREARAELLRRYFTAFGPATPEDCAYFTGWKKKGVLEALEYANLPLQTVECGGTEYFYLGSLNLDGDIPACLFLTGFDQLLMGYRDRTRMMDERYKADVTTNTGIVHPTVMLDGQIKAKWNKHGKRLDITPFTKLSERSRKLIVQRGRELFGPEIAEVRFGG